MRTGPRHAAPKKPLFTRFHMPAGKAIALAAMPTAVLMGMGFTPTLALADNQPASKSLTADEYKDCVAALEDGASSSPSPSASASDATSSGKDTASDTPSPSASSSSGTSTSEQSGKSSSSDSGSGDKTEPTPSASASASDDSSSDTATASPSASASDGNLLDTIGDAITDVFTGGSGSSSSASPTPSPSASSPASDGKDTSSSGTSASDTVKDTTKKVTDTVNGTVKDTTDAASKAAKDTTSAAEKAAQSATTSASPSASSTTNADNCPVATEAEGGVDNKVLLPDDPWYLEASSLLLKGADYEGIVKVRTADGTVKEVLKYVISDGTDIGDLHQLVKDKQSGKTYHAQAAKGSTSTIRGGATVMYTEKISGNLFGLIPITFSPDNPPPLNIPLIYFTNAKVQQAGQFGGTLTVPGLHQYATG